MIGKYVDLNRLLALAEEIPSSRKSSAVDHGTRNPMCASGSRTTRHSTSTMPISSTSSPRLGRASCSSALSTTGCRTRTATSSAGIPGTFVPELEANDRMRNAIRDISKNGTPIYAECGGLMYLTDRMVLKEGWQGRDKELFRRDVRGIPGRDPDAGPARGQHGRGQRGRVPDGCRTVPGPRVPLFGGGARTFDKICLQTLAGDRDQGNAGRCGDR